MQAAGIAGAADQAAIRIAVADIHDFVAGVPIVRVLSEGDGEPLTTAPGGGINAGREEVQAPRLRRKG